MKRDFGDLLIGALEEAASHSSGRLRAKVDRVTVTARKASASPPPLYNADRIRTLRRSLGLSQPVFAGMLNVSGSTVRAWEQGSRAPDGPSLRLLQLAELHPEVLVDTIDADGTGQKEGSKNV